MRSCFITFSWRIIVVAGPFYAGAGVFCAFVALLRQVLFCKSK
jgi:hypothetical protein